MLNSKVTIVEVMRVIRRMKRKLVRLRCRRSCFQLILWMNKTKSNKQANCFLKIFTRKPISLLLKHSRDTDWIVDPLPQVKSAEQMAKISTKIIWRISQLFWKLYQKYIKRLWNIYEYINFLFITYFPWA